jgi:predicted nucleic-acid-binding protein
VLRSAYGRQPDQLAGAVELLLNHESLTLQDPDVVAGALELYRARPSLGFSDCIILELARKAGQLPLGTFDRKLARLEGTRRL